MTARTQPLLFLPCALLVLFSAIGIQTLRGQSGGEVVLPRLDRRALLTALFESTSYSDERGVKWKPSIEERLKFTVSDDGFCYTQIDTVLEYVEGFSEIESRVAVVTFSTHSWFDGERSECHACAPETGAAVFRQEGSGWTLVALQRFLGRFGEWGVPGDASLVNLGSDHHLLAIASNFTGTGYNEEFLSLYDLVWNGDDGNSEVLTLDMSIYGPAGCEGECEGDECDEFIDIERSVQVLPDDPDSEFSGYGILRLNSVEKDCRGTVIGRSTEEYEYDGTVYHRRCE